MAYSKRNWPSGTTPISKDNLGAMDDALFEHDTNIENLNKISVMGFVLSNKKVITVDEMRTTLGTYPVLFGSALPTPATQKVENRQMVAVKKVGSDNEFDLYICLGALGDVYRWGHLGGGSSSGSEISEADIEAAVNNYFDTHPEVGNGKDGKDGISVTVLSVSESTSDGGSNVVTFSDGKTLTVKNGGKGSKGDKGDTGEQGPQGVQGEKGADGKTPVKGVDYFTESEKAEFLSSITSDADVPDYVISEADEVADKVLQSQGNRTFTFAAISDLHYGNSNYKDGIKHAFQAMNHIGKHLKLDMIAVLGDYTDGYPSTDITDAMADFKAINSLLDSVRFAPNIRQMGNHDYYADNIPVTRRLIQSHSDNVVWGDRLGGYFYRDFEDYKLRVICLNTNENNPIDTSTNKPASIISMTTQQCQWFADTLDMSTKEDAKDWQILVLSHQPLDYFATGDVCLSYIADAYKEGTSWSGNGVSCDYTDKNDAVLIGNIHGHVHNFIADTMYRGNSNSSKKTSVYRLCTPNACFGRENQYSGVWNEATTYAKTQNSAQDTSFVVYCIDLDTYTINAICYGAGYDRTLVYNIPSISYTNQLPIAIDTDGSIYNGKGWADDTRLNSSGTITAATGASTTGFIPVTENSVVRLRNVGMATTDSTTDYVHIYDENFTLILGCKTNQLSTNDYWINTVVTDETTGYITSFKLDNVSDNTRYMRLSTRVKLDDTAIITVDEEIV